MQEIFLTKTCIESNCGDVLPLQLLCKAAEGGSAAAESTVKADLSQEDIHWSVEGESVRIREFAVGAGAFRNGVLLCLIREGESRVCAAYAGKAYCCQVKVRPMRRASSEEQMEHYIGDLHIHSAKTHNTENFRKRTEDRPADLIRTIAGDGLLDFSVLTDHGVLHDNRTFFQGFTDAEEVEHKELIVFPGSESGTCILKTDRFGQQYRCYGEIGALNVTDRTDEDHDMSIRSFTDKMITAAEPVAILVHPQIISSYGMWVCDLHETDTPEFQSMVRLVEMGNGTSRASNLINEHTYSYALDCGYRVAPCCNSDCHGADYRPCPGKTVIMAPEKSKERFLDALRNNRVYATESGSVKLKYTVNGQTAPADLAPAEIYRFHVELGLLGENSDSEAMPIRCQVIADGGLKAAEVEVKNGMIEDFEVSSDSARYFYLRLVDAGGRKTWSMPVWTGRAFSDRKAPYRLRALDQSTFTVRDEVNGRDARVLINHNPMEIYESERTTASIVIDMQKEQEICGIGHAAPKIDPDAAPIAAPERISGFVGAFMVSVSRDGRKYRECRQGIARMCGCEEIFDFEPVMARYVRFEVLTTAGAASEWPEFADANVNIGELTIFGKREDIENADA